MNKTNSILSKDAFSIMELLVAMIIMIAAVMALSPVITKKHTSGKKPHGTWICSINDNGEHVSVLTNNLGQQTSKVEGTHCTFTPQPSTDKYLVTVVGGGGGGASGTSAANDAISYGEPIGYKIETDGIYDVILVGGGGGGSALFGNYGNKGGSAGYVAVYPDKKLKAGYYVLRAGAGGTAGGLSDAEQEEDEDGNIIEPESCTPSYPGDTVYKDVCNGSDGGESLIYNENRSFEVKARGGYGGHKINDINNRASRDYDVCNTRASVNSNGGYLSKIGDACTAALLSVDPSQSYIGRGGNGSASEVAYPGYNGVAIIRSTLFYSGGGGKAGGMAFSVIKDLDSEVKVSVGKGGLGATVEKTNGLPGENSSFGHYLTAKGGNGGEIQAMSASGKDKKLDGEAGSPSPFGSHGFAKGGDGGFAYSAKSTNVSETWGAGQNGSPGFVRVEWN